MLYISDCSWLPTEVVDMMRRTCGRVAGFEDPHWPPNSPAFQFADPIQTQSRQASFLQVLLPVAVSPGNFMASTFLLRFFHCSWPYTWLVCGLQDLTTRPKIQFLRIFWLRATNAALASRNCTFSAKGIHFLSDPN